MLRLFAIIGFIILCYHYPSDYQNQYLEIDNLKENTARSLYLCFAISLIWMERAALIIVLIEAMLIICNIYVGYTLESGGGIFNKHYSTLQESAYWVELIVMVIFIIREWRKSGDNLRSNIHGIVSRRRSPSGGSN